VDVDIIVSAENRMLVLTDYARLDPSINLCTLLEPLVTVVRQVDGLMTILPIAVYNGQGARTIN
jgi:hypothetical protein